MVARAEQYLFDSAGSRVAKKLRSPFVSMSRYERPIPLEECEELYRPQAQSDGTLNTTSPSTITTGLSRLLVRVSNTLRVVPCGWIAADGVFHGNTVQPRQIQPSRNHRSVR